jgi:hypothetical protein
VKSKDTKKKKDVKPKGKRVPNSEGTQFTSENQPSPEAKVEGRRKALAKRQVIEVLKEAFLNELVPLNVGGKIKQITALEAGILKIVRTYINRPDDMIKALTLIQNFERNYKMDSFRIKEAEEKKGNYETEFNDSFLQALNAQASDVWEDENEDIDKTE